MLVCLASGSALTFFGSTARATEPAETSQGTTIGPLQLVLEPGVANLAGSEEQRPDDPFPGLGLGFSTSLGIGSLFALGLHLDHKAVRLPPGSGLRWNNLTTWDVTAIYHLDLGMVRPFGAIGVAGVQRMRPGPPELPVLAPAVALGVDINPWKQLLVGAVIRYYAVGGSDIFSPSHTHLALRVGLSLGLNGPP